MKHYRDRVIYGCLRAALQAGVVLGSLGLTLTQNARAAEVTTGVPANESPAPTGADSSVLQEVVVTAQKRTERLQDVPLAVTAVSAQELANRQINDTNSLVQLVPSLNYQQGNNPTNTTFRIRGVGTALFGQGTESSVSLVIDGVVQARQAQSFADLADIERIEVLEGPQGTLFGKNSTGGVINVVTAAPSHQYSGYAEATIAEDNEYRVKGTVTGPLSDTLAYRFSSYYDNVGGWIHDIPTDSQYGGNRSYGFRAKLSWDPLDKLNVLFAADYRDAYQNCCHAVPVHLVNPTLIALYQPLVATQDNTSNEENAHSDSHDQQVTTSVTATYDMGFADLTSISALQQFQLRNNVDVDALYTPQPIFVGLQTPNYGRFDVNGGSVSLGNFTQELRLSSKSGQRLTYVGGLYYSTLSLDRPFQFRRAICPSGVLGAPCPSPTYQSAASFSHLSSSSIAAFGQAEYGLVGDLKLIAGLREQRDEISVRGQTVNPNRTGDALYPGYTNISGEVSDSNTATSGKGGLQYEFSRNSQAYVTYTRGYKGLGYNTEIAGDWAHQPPVLPETVNAYELGYKGRLFGGHLSVAADVFLAKYDNLQVQANRSNFSTGTNNFVPTNAGSSDTRGVELQLTFRPVADFSLNASIVYDEATFSMDGLDCPLEFQGASATVIPLGAARPVNACYNPQVRNASGAIVNSGPIQDIRNGALPASPRWRGTLSPRYERALSGDLEGFVQVDVTTQSQVQMALEQDPLLVQPGYTLTDLTLGLRPSSERYQISFFVKNLFDRRYFTNITHGSDLAGVANPYDVFAWRAKDAGRYVGGTLSVRF
jgi:iron complex outermembrane recepter protein